MTSQHRTPKLNYVAVLLLFLRAATSSSDGPEYGADSYATDRVLVRFRPGLAAATSLGDSLGLQLQGVVGTQGTQVFQITDGSDVSDKVEQLQKLREVAVVEPDYKVWVTKVTPSDPVYPRQWHLPKVSAPQAWDISQGSEEVKVCVVDSGAQMNHPDLAPNILKGFNLVPRNQYAADAAQPTPDDPWYWNYNDTYGHGTHVAGTIAALGNNGLGVAGLAWKVKLVICKFIYDTGSGYISDAMACLQLCRQEGALISSNSWGGLTQPSALLQEEVQRAGEEGQLFIVAAANSGINIDRFPQWPAAYNLSNIVAVASTGHQDVLSRFSNYGRTRVHLAAPGEGIISTTKDGGYGEMSGTSMATPLVTGCAALLQATAMAAGKTLSYLELKEHLLKGVDWTPGTANATITGGRLNILKALQSLLEALQPQGPSPGPEPPETIPGEAGNSTDGFNSTAAGGDGDGVGGSDLPSNGGAGAALRSYVLRQTVFATARGCGAWAARSKAAYRKAAAALVGRRAVSLRCQQAGLDVVGARQVRVTLIARLGPLELAAAQELEDRVSRGVGDGSLAALVRKQSPVAHEPRPGDGHCLVGVSTCPPARPAAAAAS